MHEPSFSKKCYDCTNRFICWTSKEKLPEIVGLPRCSKCGSQLEIIKRGFQIFRFNLGAAIHNGYNSSTNRLECVSARCPEHRLFNGHDKGNYYRVNKDLWVRLF